MGRSPKITGLLAWIVTLLAIGLVVAQDATAQETPLPNAQAYINRGLAYHNKGDTDRAIADFTQATQLDPKSAHEWGVDQTLATLQKSAQSPLGWVPPPEAVQWAPGTTENLAMCAACGRD